MRQTLLTPPRPFDNSRRRSYNGTGLGTTNIKITDATQVYVKLRRDIVKGLLKPAEKLQIKDIADRYLTGVNPVREALNRLSAEGIVDRRDRQGFFVPAISLSDYQELVKTRCWLEGKAVQESIANYSQEWEERIVLAFHRLIRKTAVLRGSEGGYVGTPEWEDLHRAFHLSLISGCGSSWLIKFCEDLMDHSHRYRNISNVLDYRERDVEAEHKGIMDAAIEKNADLAVLRLSDHYSLTLQIIEKNIELL